MVHRPTTGTVAVQRPSNYKVQWPYSRQRVKASLSPTPVPKNAASPHAASTAGACFDASKRLSACAAFLFTDAAFLAGIKPYNPAAT